MRRRRLVRAQRDGSAGTLALAIHAWSGRDDYRGARASVLTPRNASCDHRAMASRRNDARSKSSRRKAHSGGRPETVPDVEGRAVPVARIRGVEAFIDRWESGVRAHLDDGSTVALIMHDSGNVDFTATANEYLFDGMWAFRAARELAGRLGVSLIQDPPA